MTSITIPAISARIRSNRCAAIGLLSLLATLTSAAEYCESTEDKPSPSASTTMLSEPRNAGWTVQVDNDAFNGSSRDQDYTGGLAITLSGRRVLDFPISANTILDWFDRHTGVHQRDNDDTFCLGHAIQFGLVAFTPAQLESSKPIMDDRPYANLVFMTNSRFSVREDRSIAHQSHLTVGILGSPVAEWIQNGIHTLTGSTKPKGYSFQISNGGEPTARYAVSRHALLRQGSARGKRFEITHSAEASVGFLTEVSVSVFGRWGVVSTPWWTFTPARASYSPQPRPTAARHANQRMDERYLWAGFTLRARAYNAFLQGQFRHSDVVFSRDELNLLIPEFSIGVSTTVSDRWQLTYDIRYQGKEIRSGPAARNVIWAGISLQRR